MKQYELADMDVQSALATVMQDPKHGPAGEAEIALIMVTGVPPVLKENTARAFGIIELVPARLRPMIEADAVIYLEAAAWEQMTRGMHLALLDRLLLRLERKKEHPVAWRLRPYDYVHCGYLAEMAHGTNAIAYQHLLRLVQGAAKEAKGADVQGVFEWMAPAESSDAENTQNPTPRKRRTAKAAVA